MNGTNHKWNAEGCGDAEKDVFKPEVEREGNRFARMCIAYAPGHDGDIINFNSKDFSPEAIERGKKLIESKGVRLEFSPVSNRVAKTGNDTRIKLKRA